MNLEEARRAVLRREEDVTWIRLMQLFHRETGETIRRLQRQSAEERERHEAEVREAQYEFDKARAEQRAADEADTAEQRRLDRIALESQRQKDLQRRRERMKKMTEEERAREVALQRQMELREQKRKRQQQLAKQREHETAEEFAARRAELAREQAKTPSVRQKYEEKKRIEGQHTTQQQQQQQQRGKSNNNDTDDSPPPKKAQTPDPSCDRSERSHRTVTTTATRKRKPSLTSPTRRITTEDEIQAEQKQRQIHARQALELRRLQNLLASRERELKLREEAEERTRQREEAERIRGLQLAERAILEQQQHLATRDQIQKAAKKRQPRLLVPLSSSSPSAKQSGDASADSSPSAAPRYRVVSPEEAAGPMAAKPSGDFAKEATERKEAAERERIAKMKEHEAIIARKQQLNLQHVQNERRRAQLERDEAYKANLIAARESAAKEEEEERLYVAAVKAKEKEGLARLEVKRAERQKQIMVNALQMKLEAQDLALQVQESNQAHAEAARMEQERLMANRKKAAELLSLQQYKEQQRHDAIVAREVKRRAAALKAVEDARRQAIAEKDEQQALRAADRQKYDRMLKQRKMEEAARNEAFYKDADGSEGGSEHHNRKSGVPRQPKASDPVVLPPHPEIAYIQEHNEQFAKSVEQQLLGVDGRMKAIRRLRL